MKAASIGATGVQFAAADPSRRVVLAGMAATVAVTLLPLARAQGAPDTAAYEAFLAMSAIVVGPRTLDPRLAQRLFDALQSNDPSFTTSLKALAKIVDGQHPGPSNLQQMLNADHPELALLPRQIASAWFMGIIGGGDKARCVAYESALSSVIVSDILKPPTYAYGPYASWAAKPA